MFCRGAGPFTLSFFFSYPDEQAGTYMHELSHLAAGTKDYVWSPTKPYLAAWDAHVIEEFQDIDVWDVTLFYVVQPIWGPMWGGGSAQ